jgi:hypothetical protein
LRDDLRGKNSLSDAIFSTQACQNSDDPGRRHA